MTTPIRLRKADLTAVEGLIRMALRISHGAFGGLLEILHRAEQSGEVLDLYEESVPGVTMGRVVIFSVASPRPLMPGLDEVIVRFRPADEVAQELVAELPAGPPDPL